jgi:hypothetical protein
MGKQRHHEEATMAQDKREAGMNRRDFICVTVLSGSSVILAGGCAPGESGGSLTPEEILGGLREDTASTPIPGATWYEAESVGDGLTYSIPEGALAGAKYLTSDMLLDGSHMIVFMLALHEAGEDGRTFNFRFSGLNQCGLRVRLPLDLVDQNRWGIEREGAFLKPRCSGDRVDLEKIDRITLKVFRKSPVTARWCMTPFVMTDQDVEKMSAPVLTKGPLLDELGQSTLHDWPAKSKSVEEVVERIRSQLEKAPDQAWPAGFTRWGGWKKKRINKGNGYFGKHHDGERWWLVDPEGYAFWSVGLDCYRVGAYARYDGLETALKWLPEEDSEFTEAIADDRYARSEKTVTYLAANLIRALGTEGWRDKWAQIGLAEMKRLGFNTVGNWSEWEFAKQAQFPYVRPMSFRANRITNVYRDFPDIFHPEFEKEAAEYASQLSDTVDDPAFLGYFLMNEPTWGFSSELPAAGMLFNSPSCETRKELGRFLQEKYPDDAELSSAWGIQTTFSQVSAGPWRTILPEPALTDLEEFSVLMVERYFKILSEACKAVDPNHLNLGMRWAGLPPAWAVRGMRFFDVYSINCYRDIVPRDVTEGIQEQLGLPTIIGEWHFGALDVGLPSSGIGHLKNQEDRATAYRRYIEDAAANPNCVGAHWFTMYDESALGRFDGENYNIGFLDICNRPYEELGHGALASHEQIYEVATQEVNPFDDIPEYLPKLY